MTNPGRHKEFIDRLRHVLRGQGRVKIPPFDHGERGGAFLLCCSLCLAIRNNGCAIGSGVYKSCCYACIIS